MGKNTSNNPEYAQMQHGDVILTLQLFNGSTGCSFFYLSLGLVWCVG